MSVSVSESKPRGAKFATPIPAPARPRRVRWRRAVRAFHELLDDPDDTAKAQELFLAIGEREAEGRFQRFLASPNAPQMLAERPSLLAALSDRAVLERLPPDSFGRAYLDYLDRNAFQAQSLVDLDRQVRARFEREEGIAPLDEVRRWFSERYLLTHDLFHVLTDYETDGVGEATLLAFSLAQSPGRAATFLTFGAALEMARSGGLRWLRFDYQAWRRGRRAAWLPAVPWEELLALRLSTVRTLLGVAPVEAAHPNGVYRSDEREAA